MEGKISIRDYINYLIYNSEDDYDGVKSSVINEVEKAKSVDELIDALLYKIPLETYNKNNNTSNNNDYKLVY